MISGAVGPGDHDRDKSSIWLVSILGGEPRRLRGGAFRAMLSPDDSLVAYMGEPRGIWLADANGENPREFIRAGPLEFVGSPQWSSDGKRVVYRRVGPAEGGMRVTIESRGLDEDTSTVLVRGGSAPNPGAVWAQDFLMVGDRLVYARDEPEPRGRERNLWEVPVDPATGEPKGEPRRRTDWAGFAIVGLSTTADGSRLVFGNNRGQDDVWVGRLDDGGRSLLDPRRLTLDDRDDRPSCWMPDGRAVVFESNRYGSEDLLVQALDQRTAQDLVVGGADQVEPRPTPDGASLLFWKLKETGQRFGPRELLRIPVTGGPTEVVLETPQMAAFDCAREPGGSCVLLEIAFTEGGVVGTTSLLDPVAGRGESLARWEVDPSANPRVALSPDGTRFAMVRHTANDRSIRVLDVEGGEILRDIDPDGVPVASFTDVAWAPDGSGFYLAGESQRGVALVRVDRDGAGHVLYEEPTGDLLSVRPSPDGSHLAFGKRIWDVNLWTIEDF